MTEQPFYLDMLFFAVAAAFFAMLSVNGRSRAVGRWLLLPPLSAVGLYAVAGRWNGAADLVNVLSAPQRLSVLTAMGLALLLVTYRIWTRPLWALLILAAMLVASVAACWSPLFRERATEPDNIPVTMMIFSLAFVLWIALRRAAVNDAHLDRGQPIPDADPEDRVTTWPNLVFLELIALVICTVGLIVWSILIRAPLEPPADPTHSPNPAKAPWYFVGLQELLVYFDPWIAGALVPALIVIGLCALPYLDRNPEGNGSYTLTRRGPAVTIFVGAWVLLWVVPIVIGAFLRGPNWSLFGPFETPDPLRPPPMTYANFSERAWGFLGAPGMADLDGSGRMLFRELPGIAFLTVYAVGTAWAVKTTLFKRAYAQMGFTRFAIMTVLLLAMGLLPIKMLLRWLLEVQYIVALTEWSFNI